jgi:hypothetical protein
VKPEEALQLKPGDPVITLMHGGKDQGRSRNTVLYVRRVTKGGKIQVIGYPHNRQGGHVMSLRPYQVERA